MRSTTPSLRNIPQVGSLPFGIVGVDGLHLSPALGGGLDGALNFAPRSRCWVAGPAQLSMSEFCSSPLFQIKDDSPLVGIKGTDPAERSRPIRRHLFTPRFNARPAPSRITLRQIKNHATLFTHASRTCNVPPSSNMGSVCNSVFVTHLTSSSSLVSTCNWRLGQVHVYTINT